MIKTRILVGLAAAGALLAACGSSDSSSPRPPAGSAATVRRHLTAPAPAAAAGASVSVKAATSPLGQILVGADGRTLYAFTNDTEAKSTCTGTCAEAWPPVVVDRQLDRGPRPRHRRLQHRRPRRRDRAADGRPVPALLLLRRRPPR